MMTDGFLMTISRVTALFIILYSLFKGRGGRAGWIVPMVFIVSVSCTARWLDSGTPGLMLVASGMAAGALVTALLLVLRVRGLNRLAAPVYIGGLTGPAGVVMVFALVFCLILLERVLHGERTRVRDRFAGFLSEAETLESSAICSPGAGRDTEPPKTGPAGEDTVRPEPAFPLAAKIAFATLVVLFSGSTF